MTPELAPFDPFVSSLHVDRRGQERLPDQICAQVKEAARRGLLPDGSRLPSSRDLARALGVNRTTVVESYRLLQHQGWLQSDVGKGSFVTVPAHTTSSRRSPIAVSDSVQWPAVCTSVAASPRPTVSGEKPPASGEGRSASDVRQGIALSKAVTHASMYPTEEIQDAFAATFRDLGSSALDYPPPAGFEPLREQLMKRLARHGIDVQKNEILILNGSQQGVDLVARYLLGSQSSVVCERPTFSGAIDVFRHQRCRRIAVPIDADGLDTDALGRVLARHRPRVLYTIPDHHNPTGVRMSDVRRERLMELVEQHDLIVLEDDWLSELRSDGDPRPLKARDVHGRVLYLGTFSKVLVPGLRLGWMVIPKPAFPALVTLKRACDLASNLPSQSVVHRLLADGFFDRHMVRVQQEFRRLRQLADRTIDQHFPRWARPLRPHHGMVMWVPLPAQVDVQRLIDNAARRGVEITGGSAFDPLHEPLSGIRISYASTTDTDLVQALQKLGELLRATLTALSAANHSPSPVLV